MVAVQTDHSSLLVNVRGQLVAFYSPGTITAPVSGVWGAIVPVKVTVMTAVIIIAHMVAVMTGEALVIPGAGQEFVIFQTAGGEFQVTGPATGSMACCRIGIAFIIEVAAQAASAQEIINKVQGGSRRLFACNFSERLEIVICAKGTAHQVDFVLQGKMTCMADIFGLDGMTFAAAGSQITGMGRFFDQPIMGSSPGGSRAFALMAFNTGKIVVGIMLKLVAALTEVLLWRTGLA